jgi:polyisoprenoid-binding protein YceI
MAWNIDAVHSQATFSVKHMMISTVRGRFDVLSGKLDIDEAHPENSWVEAEGHLVSADFFDVAQFPKITFKSTKVEPVGKDEYRVIGDLTIHGVTKQETFHAEYSGQLKDLYGLQRAAFSVKGTVNRKDFGLNWNVALESGGVLVGDKVNIEIDLAAVQQAAVDASATQTA